MGTQTHVPQSLAHPSQDPPSPPSPALLALVVFTAAGFPGTQECTDTIALSLGIPRGQGYVFCHILWFWAWLWHFKSLS